MLLSKFATQSLKTAARACSFHASAAVNAKVAVLGAAGGIGQPLSLLLKLSPEVDELSCYDIVGTPGVAADLSHVRTERRMIRCFRRSS
jgi:malate dehydrogenase